MKTTIAQRLGINLLVTGILFCGFGVQQVISTAGFIWTERETKLMHQVEAATSIVEAFHSQVERGVMLDSVARDRAKEALAAMRWGDNDYIFVLTDNGVLEVHPDQSIVGTNALEIQDPNGVFHYAEMLEAARAGGGFVRYKQPRAGTAQPLPKMSFATQVNGWDWIVVTGVYTDDVDSLIMSETVKLIACAFLLLTISMIFSQFINRSIVHPLRTLKDAVRALHSGKAHTKVDAAEREDEVGEVAKEVLALRDAIIEKERLEAEADAKRAQAEAERRDAEAARLDQERAMEEERTAAAERQEQARKRAEDARERAELSMREAETAQRTAETAKEEAEVARQEAEVASAAAREAQRQQEEVVSQLADGLSTLARGDLSFSFTQPFPTEYEELRSNFNSAVKALSAAMSDVMSAASQLKDDTLDVSQATDNLSQRTEQQAATLEQTTAAVTEVSATVQQSTQGAKDVERIVKATEDQSREADRIVKETVEAITRIERSSSEINSIINVIDDIAFQTNLLALNAGVEAARAGDAGRGFAVVAQEVRGLAQRCTGAAQEIKELISTSAKNVADGVTLVESTGASLRDIVERIGEISGLAGEIANSSEEQSIALQEVTKAISELDTVTQQNAAMAEQTTAASHSIRSGSVRLTELVGQFRIDPYQEQTSGSFETDDLRLAG
ncbi:MAG: methyl-accepting chemotaxis protein [Pseudomonadota bacterium]